MIFREAFIEDIPQLQRVRNVVRENTLSDPALVSDSDVADYITNRGKGWVCDIDGFITGFAIVSTRDHNVWALFIDPEFEKKGIGRKLHEMMMDWYFKQTSQPIWLGTAPGTRAERFYRQAGWIETGMNGPIELKFEMTAQRWKNRF